MGKSKAALPDLTKVIELKMDFTAVSALKTFLKENLRELERGNLFLKVRTGMLVIAGGYRKPLCCSGLDNKRHPKSLESKVCVREEQWVHTLIFRSLAVMFSLSFRKTTAWRMHHRARCGSEK